MFKSVHRTLFAVVLALALFSCTAPSSLYHFERNNEEGVYDFTFDKVDPEAVYDMYILTRFYCHDSLVARCGDIAMNIAFERLEDSLCVSENVYYPLSAPSSSSNDCKEFCVLYRSGLSGCSGFDMRISLAHPDVIPEGFSGIGVQLLKENGKR